MIKRKCQQTVICVLSVLWLAACNEQPGNHKGGTSTTGDSSKVQQSEGAGEVRHETATSPSEAPQTPKEKPRPEAGDGTWLEDAEAKLHRWADYQRQSMPRFALKDFVLADTFLDMDFPVLPLMESDPGFEAYRIFSPDGTLALDIYSYGRKLKKKKNGKTALAGKSPDTEVALHGPAPGNRTRLLFCGTPCHFDDAAWLDDHLVVVAGYSEEFGGEPQPVLWKVDTKNKSVSRYLFPEAMPEENKAYVERVVFGPS